MPLQVAAGHGLGDDPLLAAWHVEHYLGGLKFVPVTPPLPALPTGAVHGLLVLLVHGGICLSLFVSRLLSMFQGMLLHLLGTISEAKTRDRHHEALQHSQGQRMAWRTIWS
eukprot:TRINITY_DN57770_c0_g1_i3.p2 TRINITY_DN57770_c0_g1~~TRINITY_DN57770_c0_g1_i3.p2  ORF type:complete len:111 (-),score=14.73 TRINITY_DN57770_c0_g1_i3:157-489(-)